MLVSELITFLQSQPQDLPVVFSKFSEQVLMTTDHIEILEACPARPDGWVQNKRPDIPTVRYLSFPGN